MSTLGTWAADHIIIQAVANAINLRINITETAPNFSESSTVSSIYTGNETRQRNIYIGHLDELHYVSTTAISHCISTQLIDQTKSNKPKEISRNSQSNKTSWKETVSIKNSEKRKQYMKEYMKKKRMNNEFRKKEIERKKLYNKNYKRSQTKKIRKSWQKASAAYRKENSQKVKESIKKAIEAYRKTNREKVKEICKKASAIYRKENPGKVKESYKKAAGRYMKANPSKVKESKKRANLIYNQNYPEKVQNIQKRNYLRRKLSYVGNENRSKHKTLEINSHDNLLETLEETSGDTRSPISIDKTIKLFHKSISAGPEYTCTCCDQLWYKSSVTKCNPSLYQSCSKEILDLCLTGLKSIDNTEWICGTCHSNLKDGKLPPCVKANKMTFPDKPDVLKDLTPLEERLISPRIPFMQVRELPSGGQLSIHGNVVNVPADVNSTVNVLPRPINESQTIPIKLKRRLGYKHHYQFQNIRPTKVLEAAQYLVRNSEISKNEGIQVMDNYTPSTVNEDEWSEFIHSEDVDNLNIQSEQIAETPDHRIDNDTDDEWCETTEQSSGVMDTLLQEPDITQGGDRIISFAPGEGNRPLGIFMDKDSEFLSFPTIYCGKRQVDNTERLVPVHYSTI